MNKYWQILRLIKTTCNGASMKCNDVNYATIKKRCGLDTKHFSGTLNYLKQIGYLKRVDKSWKMTKAGEDALEALKDPDIPPQTNKLLSKMTVCLKTIFEDLNAMQRCEIVPTKKWMSSTCHKIDAIVKHDFA